MSQASNIRGSVSGVEIDDIRCVIKGCALVFELVAATVILTPVELGTRVILLLSNPHGCLLFVSLVL